MMQRRIELPRLEIRCQAAGLRALRQDQFARPAHAVLGVDRQRERGRFQRQRQRAAGRARAARPGAHIAIQEQAIAGLQHDLAAVAGQVQRPQAAAARRVDGQARAEASARRPAHHDGDITGAIGDARRVPVQRAAQQDAAACLRLAVAATVNVHATGGGRRRPASPRRRSRWRGCASWSRGCRARRRPARRYQLDATAGARSAPSTVIRLLPPPSRRIARPGSTDTSAPAPISMSAPSSMRCERSVRSAGARAASARP